MKKLISILILLALSLTCSYAQRTGGFRHIRLDDNAGTAVTFDVLGSALGINNAIPDLSSVVDIYATNRGVLFPRLSSAQRSAIINPAQGLWLFNNTTTRFEYNYGTPVTPNWQEILTGSTGWQTAGNTGLVDGTNNFLGTLDAQPIRFITNGTANERMRIDAVGNIGIGTLPAPNGLVNISKTITATSQSYGLLNTTNMNPSAASSASSFGMSESFQVNNTFAETGFLIGASFFGQASTLSTTNIATLAALSGNLSNYGTGLMGIGYAVNAQIQSQNSGQITNASNFHAVSFFAGTAGATNLRGLFIENPLVNTPGAVANVYGIDISALTSGTTNTAFRYNHATNPVVITGNGDVFIGQLTSPYNSALVVSRSSTFPTAGQPLVAQETQLLVAPSANSGSQFTGIYSHADANNTTNFNAGGGVFGLWGGANINAAATGTIDQVRGTVGEVFWNNGTTTVADAACFGGIYTMASGVSTLAQSFRAKLNLSGGTITDLKIFNIPDIIHTGGTITNTYGLYIGDITSGTQTNKAYSIYVSDPNTRSFIDGKTGFGSAFPGSANDPQTAVDISGALSIRYNNATSSYGVAGSYTHSIFISDGGFTDVTVSAAGVSFRGIAGGSNGRIYIMHVTSGGVPFTLNNEDAGEPTPANRIHCMSGANVVITAEALVTFIYQGGLGLNRWLIQSISTN